MKCTFLIAAIFSLSSCSADRTILGEWGSSQLITKSGKEIVSLNISKGDFRYNTWIFYPDGSLVMGRYKAQYSIYNDTVTINAGNGHTSIVAIVKLSDGELRLRDLTIGDSVVTVLKRLQ